MDSADVAHLPATSQAARDQTLAGAGESEKVANYTKPEESVAFRPTGSTERLAPSSPMLDLETDLPPGETE